MADRQTTGGYPIVATVITADLPVVGPARAGRLGRVRRCARAPRRWRRWRASRPPMAAVPEPAVQPGVAAGAAHHARRRRARAVVHARRRRPTTSRRRTRGPRRAACRCCVLGGGSNLVIADEGVDGLVVRGCAARAGGRPRTPTTLTVDGGGGRAVGRAWSRPRWRAAGAGVECLSGIPGTRRRHADPERRRLRTGGRRRHRRGARSSIASAARWRG